MKRFIFILLVITLYIIHPSFAQNWIWAQKAGNVKSDKITSIKTDSLGFIYIAGYFSTGLTLGTNAVPLTYTGSSSSKEAYLAKFDSTGFCYWARSGGQVFDDRVLGMDVDAVGNSIITGTYWQTGAGFVMGSINVTSSGYGWGDQCFVVKHDKNGNVLWGQFICSEDSDDQGLDAAYDNKGNVYVVGFMSGNTLHCGGSVVTATNPNIDMYKHCYWLCKINSAGVCQWARTFGNLPWDTAAFKYIERDIAVATDKNGGVYVTGGFNHTRKFGSNSYTSLGGTDIFVVKYDTNGNHQWTTTGGSKKDDWSNGICTDKQGNVYITGEHRDSLFVDTIIIKNYSKRDCFVIKLDASTGKPIWGKRAGSNLGGERGNDIVTDATCNVYVAGDINDAAKFGDNIITPSGALEQAFVARISPDGKWMWAATGGGLDSNDRCNAIAKGKGAQIYAAGYFRSPATYGPSTLISSGSSDGFFARLHDSMLNKGPELHLIIPDDLVICKGDTTHVTQPLTQFLNITPNTGVYTNTTNTQIDFFPTTTTTYTIVALDDGLCPDLDTIIFTIEVAQPHAEFNINPTETDVSSPTFTLNNTSTNATNYYWYYNSTLFSTSLNTTITFDTAGKYCITLVANYNAECNDTTTNCATIYQNENILFPNAFTPNDDNLNDEFKPIISTIDKLNITNYFFQIRNRWGQVVFESDDVSHGWNGKHDDTKIADNGTYFYICKIVTRRGKKLEYKGDVTLIR